MSYVALYRKYRPKTFDEVYGQSAIVQTLKNQIISNRIGHAYLFSGPRGTGKTSISKIFAKTINCKNSINGNPCLQCESCKTIANGFNVDIIEIDAASNNGVDNIRELIEESKYMPQNGIYKVYIIDEVHMLSTSAFNALLKTLEEPSPNVVFILATTEERAVPVTIYSRCQRFHFKLINNKEIVNSLKDILIKENIQWDDDKTLFHIANLAHGGLRDALSLLDQCTAFASGKITIDIIKEVLGEVEDAIIIAMAEAIENKNVSLLLDIISTQEQNGKQLTGICMDLYNYYKDLYFNNPDTSPIIYQRYMQILAELPRKIEYNNNRTIFEIEMIKMCTPQMETDYSALHHRIKQLEDIVDKLVNKQTTEVSMYEEDIVTVHIDALKKFSIDTYYI